MEEAARSSKIRFRLGLGLQRFPATERRENGLRFIGNMIGLGPIVCGGGWRSRRHFHVEFWRIILFLLTFIAALGFGDRFGVWGLTVPVAVFLAPIILFRLNRGFRRWLGVPDELIAERAQAAPGRKPPPNVPTHDLHNLH